MANFEKINFKNGYAFYKDPSMCPLDEVAKILGVELFRNGVNYKLRDPTPGHDDFHPSAQLTMTGKYQNTWKCWSSGEGGGPLEMVMAIRSGIVPSEYWDVMRHPNNYSPDTVIKMHKARTEAAKFIESYFPGNIEILNGNEIKQIEDKPLPFLPDWIKENLGIDKMLRPKFVKDVSQDGSYKMVKYDTLDKEQSATLILDKLFEYQLNLKDYKKKIFKDFPELDMSAKAYISEVTGARIEALDIFSQIYREYLLDIQKVHDDDMIENWIEDFDDDLEESYNNIEEEEEDLDIE